MSFLREQLNRVVLYKNSSISHTAARDVAEPVSLQEAVDVAEFAFQLAVASKKPIASETLEEIISSIDHVRILSLSLAHGKMLRGDLSPSGLVDIGLRLDELNSKTSSLVVRSLQNI